MRSSVSVGHGTMMKLNKLNMLIELQLYGCVSNLGYTSKMAILLGQMLEFTGRFWCVLVILLYQNPYIDISEGRPIRVHWGSSGPSFWPETHRKWRHILREVVTLMQGTRMNFPHECIAGIRASSKSERGWRRRAGLRTGKWIRV
jgi:hypothetical protein